MPFNFILRTLSALLFFISTALLPCTLSAEDLWYTVQLGSFHRQTDANILYEKVRMSLPLEFRQTLRLEKISSYYTVRTGKFQTRQEAASLISVINAFSSPPLILQAYIRPERILAGFSSVASQPFSSKSSEEDTTLRTENSKVAAKQTPSTIEDDTPRQQDTSQPATLSTERPPAPMPLDNDSLISKYLQPPAQQKESAQARKKMASFDEAPHCTSMNCHQTILEAPIPEAPIKAQRCPACHRQTNANHPSKNPPDLMLTASGAALCEKCHTLNRETTTIHTPFSEGQCTSCHDPHGSENPLFLRGNGAIGTLCFDCHDNNSFSFLYPHGPVEMGACNSCHTSHDSNQKALLLGPINSLCLKCHTEFIQGLKDSPTVHRPVQEGSCTTCHNPHGSEFPNLLIKKPQVFCFSCHPDIQSKFEKSKFKHSGLSLEKQCGTCHLAHYSTNQGLLVKKEMDLCLTCHGETSSLESFKPANIQKELDNKEYIHGPIQKGECISCHDQHGSNYKKLLRNEYPSGLYAPYNEDTYALCFICHDKEGITDQKTTTKTQFRNGDKNLHYTHVSIDQKGRTCRACHRSHASDGPKLISRSGANFGAWTMSIDFSINETGGKCTPGCHRTFSYDRENPIPYTKEDQIYDKYYIEYKSN